MATGACAAIVASAETVALEEIVVSEAIEVSREIEASEVTEASETIVVLTEGLIAVGQEALTAGSIEASTADKLGALIEVLIAASIAAGLTVDLTEALIAASEEADSIAALTAASTAAGSIAGSTEVTIAASIAVSTGADSAAVSMVEAFSTEASTAQDSTDAAFMGRDMVLASLAAAWSAEPLSPHTPLAVSTDLAPIRSISMTMASTGFMPHHAAIAGSATKVVRTPSWPLWPPVQSSVLRRV